MKLVNFARFAGIAILTLTIASGCAANQVTDSNAEQTNIASTQNTKPKFNTTENGVAIKGTDPVAYFQQGKAIKGNKQYSYEWGNATWQFSSAANRDLFAKNPEKYVPQYGGFCAWAVSQGYTAPIDPNAWKIVDGKLYLNFNKSIQRTWERDIPGNIAKADRNWPGILNR